VITASFPKTCNPLTRAACNKRGNDYETQT
jgi:hypothetical protein